jgi:cytochrome b
MNDNDTRVPGTTSQKPHKPVAAGGWVTDAPTRMFHWLFALSFLIAYLSADADGWRRLHVTMGYTFGGLLVFRLLYGWLGPKPLGWGPLKRKVAGVGPWLKTWVQPGVRVNWRQGQNVALATSIAVILGVVAPLVLTGYGFYQKWAGHWLKEVHEWLGTVLLWAVLAHVGLLLVLSLVRRQNQALPMLTGRSSMAGPGPIKQRRGWLAGLVLAAVLGFVVMQWQDSPNGLLPGPGDVAESVYPSKLGDDD